MASDISITWPEISDRNFICFEWHKDSWWFTGSDRKWSANRPLRKISPSKFIDNLRHNALTQLTQLIKSSYYRYYQNCILLIKVLKVEKIISRLSTSRFIVSASIELLKKYLYVIFCQIYEDLFYLSKMLCNLIHWF